MKMQKELQEGNILSRKFSFLKKSFVAFIFIAVFAVSASARNLDFRLVNSTGLVMYRLYLSPSEFTRFDFDQDEITGAFPLDSGYYTDIQIRNPNRQRFSHWDMRVYFRDSKYISIYRIDLSKISKLTIDDDGDAYDNLGNFYTIKYND